MDVALRTARGLQLSVALRSAIGLLSESCEAVCRRLSAGLEVIGDSMLGKASDLLHKDPPVLMRASGPVAATLLLGNCSLALQLPAVSQIGSDRTHHKAGRQRRRTSLQSAVNGVDGASAVPAAGTLCYDGACDYRDLSDEYPVTSQPRKQSANRPTVWSEFSALAAETGAINLGQGFPNWEPPDFVIEAGVKALQSGHNQYTRTAGHPRLVELLAGRYTKHFGRTVNPYTQVAITIGASQALYVTMQVRSL